MEARVRTRGEAWSYGSVSLILAAWIYDLHFHWNSLPEYNFGWIVLLLSSYLVWDRWAQRPGTDWPSSTPMGAGLAVAAVPLVLISQLYTIGIARTAAATFTLSCGCFCFVAAILLLGCGRLTFNHFLFPLLFLFVAVPIPKIIWNPVVISLQDLITTLDVEALNLLGIPAIQQGTTILLKNTVVGVDEACSGVRSLQSSVMAALFVGFLILRTKSLRALLVATGVILALLGNFIRSLTLSIAANEGGRAALDRLHDGAGWSILAVTAVGLVIASWMLCRVERGLQADPSSKEESVATPETNLGEPVSVRPASVAPLLLLALFVLSVSGAWAWFHVRTGPRPLRYTFDLRHNVPGYEFKAEAVPTEAQKILGTSQVVNGRYVGADNEIAVFAGIWDSGRNNMSVVQHTPDICWVAGGWKPIPTGRPAAVDLALGDRSVPFECRVFSAPGGGTKQLTLWCTLLSGDVLREGERWTTEDQTTTGARARLESSSRRLALSQLATVLKARTPGTGRKEFVRVSMPVAGEDLDGALTRLQIFTRLWLQMKPVEKTSG